jgi:hypothetical protein
MNKQKGFAKPNIEDHNTVWLWLKIENIHQNKMNKFSGLHNVYFSKIISSKRKTFIRLKTSIHNVHKLKMG